MLAKIGKADHMEIVTAAFGIAWAFRSAGVLTTSVLETIHQAAMHVGHTYNVLFVKNDDPHIIANYWAHIVASFSD